MLVTAHSARPVAKLHNLNVWSELQVKARADAQSTSTSCTMSVWPVMTCKHSPQATSHNLGTAEHMNMNCPGGPRTPSKALVLMGFGRPRAPGTVLIHMLGGPNDRREQSKLHVSALFDSQSTATPFTGCVWPFSSRMAEPPARSHNHKPHKRALPRIGQEQITKYSNCETSVSGGGLGSEIVQNKSKIL